MVEEQLKARDINDQRVLSAMRSVPRHLFIPESARGGAYGDFPVPIGHGQTDLSALHRGLHDGSVESRGPDHRVLRDRNRLRIPGGGAQVLAKEVFTIGDSRAACSRARATLVDLGYRNVEVRTGNRYLGWPDHAPSIASSSPQLRRTYLPRWCSS